MKRILAVSDKVLPTLYSPEVNSYYPNLDLLIGCGDLPYYYLDFLVSAIDRPMLFVLGNHDAGRQYSAERGELRGVRGGQNVHARSVHEQGLLIAGLEGSMRYHPDRPQQYTDGEMERQISRLIPTLLLNRVRYGRYLDLLITHSPPFGIHDQDDLTHTGFRSFLPFMRVFKPRYLLHGHIHRYNNHQHEQTRYESTTVINVYPSFYMEL